VAESGSDIWFEKPVEAFLPDGFACQHCGGKKFRKEEDILDVWFDSSVSHRAVLEHHAELTWPCDLYLEASDQHRGWFQVSLLTAVSTRGKAPYRQVLTHGLILDEAAKKMSKSLGNVIAPEEIISEFGADVLRLLFASIDYTADVCFTRGMVAPISDAYRKIRNTIRFMLGNLSDFNPNQHSLPETKLAELDRWMLARLRQVVRRVCDAYAAYEFHIAYRLLLDVCTVDLSAFYLDIIKDRLYVEDRNGHNRRSAQTALYRTTLDLLTMLAPIVSFTADEAWGFLPAAQKQASSVHLAQLPLPVEGVDDAAVLERWNRLRKVRSEMNKALEIVRKAGSIGSSLDAELTLAADAETVAFLRSFGSELIDVVKVADLTLDGSVSDQAFVSSELPGLSIEVKRATTQKCARCWNRRPEVGSLSQAPDLCRRCNDVVQSSR
jgi:isoleucyl-tRNA synthetase